MSLEPKFKNKLVNILSILFPNAKIILFGSRARGTHQEFSDIDIAIDAGKKLPFESIGEAQDVARSLYSPYNIDIVDFHRASDEMQEIIKSEGILWKS